MITFGGAYPVLPYVAQQAVENYAWLSPGQMIDALGLAETTPGPLVMVFHQETQFFKLSDVLRHPPQLLSYALSHQDEPEESKSYTA
jgi:chromate transporter